MLLFTSFLEARDFSHVRLHGDFSRKRCLHMEGYRYASELAGKGWDDFKNIEGFGAKSYQYLQDALRDSGII